MVTHRRDKLPIAKSTKLLQRFYAFLAKERGNCRFCTFFPSYIKKLYTHIRTQKLTLIINLIYLLLVIFNLFYILHRQNGENMQFGGFRYHEGTFYIVNFCTFCKNHA